MAGCCRELVLQVTASDCMSAAMQQLAASIKLDMLYQPVNKIDSLSLCDHIGNHFPSSIIPCFS